MKRTEIRIAGFGGQGVVLAGVLIGTAAAVTDGRRAVQTQSYGAAARGGGARSEVVISDDPVIYPRVTHPDIMVAMSEEAMKTGDREMLEDLIRAAVNQAIDRARQQVAEETSKMATGLGLPEGMQLPGLN